MKISWEEEDTFIAEVTHEDRTISMQFEMMNGSPGLTSFLIESDRAITTGDFRDIPIGRYMASARALAMGGPAEFDVSEWSTRTAHRSDLAYANLAGLYAHLVASGSRRPAEEVGEAIGMSPVTVSQRMREARAKGLLTETGNGKAGGELTEKALRLLGASA